jgi:CubicO group peptidase (beta-lactamase class C family)
VQKHLPNFTYNRQGWKEHLNLNGISEVESDPITLRQLASHMAGIGKLPPYNFDWWPYPPPKLPTLRWPTLEEQLESIAKLPLITPPYAFPVYSNTGFSLLGASLTSAYSHATGNETTYSELLKRDIFTPLGMNGSSFVVSDQNRDHLAIPRQGDEIVCAL